MELTFEKWEDGRWFVVLPEYDGDQEDLEMVDGADALLDYLTEDCLYVTVDVSLEETEDLPIQLRLVAHDEIGGTYQVENLGGFRQDIWLCNVVHFVYGEHPEIIYFRQLKEWKYRLRQSIQKPKQISCQDCN